MVCSIAKLLDRIVEIDSPSIIVTYENRIRELENRKAELNEKIRKCGTVLPDFDETFRTAFSFLSNPHKIWCSDRLENKRTVLKLAFADKLSYCRNEGFRTAPYALPFALLEDFGQGNYNWWVWLDSNQRPRDYESQIPHIYAYLQELI